MIAVVLARPRATLAAILLSTLALAAALPGLRFDNTPDTWLPMAGEDLATYERFRERFGEDSLIVAFTAEAKPESAAWRADFAALAESVRQLEGVSWVDTPSWEPSRDGWVSPLAEHLRSDDGTRAAIALFPEPALDAQGRGRLVARLESELEKGGGRVGGLRLAGADVITHDLDLGSKRSLGGLAPLVGLIMCGIFGAATRSARAVGAMLLAVVAASIGTLGLLALAGRTLNLVVVVVPAILAVVTCAQATHLLSRFASLEPGDATDSAARVRWWREAVAGCWRPCLLSAVTTAVGFASLGISEIPPIRDLGAFTAVGVLASFGLTFSLIPALLVRSPRVAPRSPAARWWTPQRAVALGASLRRRALPILVAAAALMGVCGLGLGDLALESHILRFFPSDHRIPQNYAAIEADLLALTPIELELAGPSEAVLSGETVAALDRYLAEALAAEPLLRQTLSPLVGDAPPERRALRLAAALEAGALPAELERFVFSDGERVVARTTLAARTASSNACDELIARLRERLRGAFPDAVDARITGAATLLIHGQKLLLETQVRSFAIALGVITLVIAAVFRSPWLVAVSLIPNLMPVVLTLGLMGLFAVPLDTATVTVAGIALGLIVDDTIHLLHGYWGARRRGIDAPDAVAETLYRVGRPVLVTSLAVAAGFGAFAISPFRPTLYFGLLIAGASVAAVVCDLVVLPALLQLGAKRRDADALAPARS